MFRRTLTFVAFVALVAAVSGLVYLNPAETSFRYPPANELTLPLGVLLMAATLAGMVVMFLLMLLREGRNAVREWRVQRGIRSAERTAAVRAEARSLALAGDYPRARSLFAKAMKSRDPDVADLLDYAETYLQEDNAREAKRVIENGQKDFGNEPLLLVALARAARAAGDDAGAASALERALEVYPRSLRILAPLRDVLIDSGAWARAAQIQERIVQLKPNDAGEANRLQGTRYEAALRRPPSERIAGLKAVSSADPDFAPAVLERARTTAAEGDPGKAARILEKSVRRRPHGALLDELEHLLAERDAGRVAKTYLRAVEAFPLLDGLRARAAEFLARHGRSDEADALLRAATSNDTRGVLTAAHALLEQAHGQLAASIGKGTALLATRARSARQWRCSNCGGLADAWTARCRHCGSWGLVDDL